MAKISTESAKVAGVRVRAVGFEGEAEQGLPAARGGPSRVDDVEKALGALAADGDGAPGVSVLAQLTVRPDWSRGPSRGRGPTWTKDEVPTLELEGPADAGVEKQIAVVEEEGLIRFVLPKDGTRNQFAVPLGDSLAADSSADRGLSFKAGALVIRLIGVVGGKKLAQRGFEVAVRAVEDRSRPHRLRTFLPGDFRQKPGDATAVRVSTGPAALLLLHGVNSSSHSCFRFSQGYVKKLAQRYGDRVMAFDHPSLGYSPEDNAARLAELLGPFRFDDLDILAHSRGGLVARELAAAPPDGVHIRSIVHVATPNGGTALADAEHLGQFLSVATNVIGLIPDNPVTDVVGIVLEVLREWALNPVAELPGIAAMKPTSADLAELNQRPPPAAEQRAIAAAFEPRSNHGALLRLRDLVMDGVFLGEENDLLVPTRSTYGRRDQFHIAADRRLVLDTSFGVGHSQFWTEPMVTTCLDRWLDPAVDPDKSEPIPAALTDPAAELDDAMATGNMAALRQAIDVLSSDKVGAIAEIIGVPVRGAGSVARARTKRGTVIVLPGLMGSRLTTKGREVWFSPWHLMRGRFTDLRMDVESPPVVEVTGLMRQYAPLIGKLDESWDVIPFPFDWRLSIRDSARRLGELVEARGLDIEGDRPVHFVGHSMGGLVARLFLAQQCDNSRTPSGRLLQLGTPNWGSFAMPLAVCGEERLTRALALADVFNDAEEILDTIASFPGVLQLFPSPDRLLPGSTLAEHQRLYERPVWPKRSVVDLEVLLNDAMAFHRELKVPELKGMVFVAGDGQTTPYRARVEADGQISFGVTKSGDGRVPHVFGPLDLQIPRVYYASCNHGDLISDPEVLAALDDLLDTGETDSLPTEAGSARDAAAPEPETWLKASQLERTFVAAGGSRGGDDGRRDRGAALLQASEIYVGATGAPRPGLAPIKVRIVHGSLEQARHPVAAGRYKGIPIDGALGFIDDRFGGALSDLHEAGLYPDDAGTARYLRAPEHVYPLGAILLGLGEFGSLTPDLLARAVERGTADYALAEQRQSRTDGELGVSAVLVGTPGRYGLTIVTSILATIRGVARASVKLQGKVTITELEIIELSEARAIDAAMALERLDQSEELKTLEAPIVIDTRIEARAGGRPGSHGYEESGAPWPRLMLELADPRPEDLNLAERPKDEVRTLRYVSLGRRAQASNLEVDVVLSQIDRHVRAAIQNPSADAQTNNTLFELLLPNEAKLELEALENLHLLVDESTAWIPWEMIAGRETTGQRSRPLALRAGLLRQLKPRESEAPRKILRAVGDTALVIGDPPSDLHRLAGARQEAGLVADALDASSFTVERCIYGEDDVTSPELSANLLDAFFAQHHRIVHIAAHGSFDDDSDKPARNGVVIGEGEVLGPVQFRQRLVAPDLVFLNCCHIGRIDEQDQAVGERSQKFAHLAASLALELLRSGVTAVVAAGWAVDDRDAGEFATTFYRCMLSGQSFGEAVKEARIAAHGQGQGRTNTWAAYQCYGDPDFQLVTSRSHSRRSHTIFSPRHLVNELKAAEKRAGDAADKEHVGEVVRAIRELQVTAEAQFRGNAEVWLALAQAYGEAGAFERAVLAYRLAIEHDEAAERSVRTIDSYRQLANLEARLAAQIARQEVGPLPFGADEPRITEKPQTLFRRAEQRLGRLRRLDQSAEWSAIRGSLYKKRASTLEGSGRQDDIRRSMNAYRDAVRVNNPTESPETDFNVYHASLTLLMAYALEWPDDTAAIRDAYLTRLRVQKASYDRDTGDYWERARIADIDATEIVVGGGLLDEAGRAELVNGFVLAFRVRSTLRNRVSVIDNYHDLSHLLPSEDLRSAAGNVAAELTRFRPARAAARTPTP